MFQFTPKRKENTAKVLVGLVVATFVTLVAGSLVSTKGFLLPIFSLGCILIISFYVLLLMVEP